MIPLVAWLVSTLKTLPEGSPLRLWVTILIGFNALSLVVDIIDVIRYFRGEKKPIYSL